MSPEADDRTIAPSPEIDDFPLVDNLCWSWRDPARFRRTISLVAEHAARIAGSESAAVFFVDQISNEMLLLADLNMSDDAKSAAEREVARASADSRTVTLANGFATFLMTAEDSLCGAISIPFVESHPLPDTVVDRLMVFSHRAAVSVVRGRQCMEAFERLRIIDDLLDTSSAVLEDVELSTVLQTIAERAARAVNAEHAAVGLIDRKTREIHYVESYGALSGMITGSRMPLDISMRKLLSGSGEPVVINDAAKDPRVPSMIVDEFGVRSLLVVPMRIRKRLIGVLIAANRIGGPFASRDIQVFKTIANHGAVAVAHAEFYAMERESKAGLEAEKMKIEAVLEQLGDGVVVCDADGRIVMMNNAAQRTIGVTQSFAVGKTLSDMHPPPYRHEIDLMMRQLAESDPEEGLAWEQRISVPGKKVLLVNIRPVFLNDGTFVGSAAVLRDITEQVEVDQTKNEFISTVAHELRTPLTVLKGSLGLILGGAVGEIEPGAREMISLALNNSDRLIRLVDDMLDVAKIEAGHLRLNMDIVPVQERVLRAVQQMSQIADERQVQIVTKVKGHLHSVVGDGDRIEQVVVNLISNALKFAPSGSTVTVAAERVRGHIRVSVKDQGPGIPADKRMKVFEKFYQVDVHPRQKESGSGLGLAISKAIVEQHGGRMTVRSTEGKGSTFSFLLPVPGEESLMPEERDEQ